VSGLTSGPPDRDRDAAGRPRNSRARDHLGRPIGRGERPTAAPTTELAHPTTPTPTETLSQAQSLLDDGLPFTAHEVLEARWKATTGPERELWRGLAQLAVGLTHRLRGNDVGACALLSRAADTLEAYAGTCPYEVPVDSLRTWAIAAARDLTDAGRPPALTARPADGRTS
jgi:hypothetical protein